MPGPKLEPLLLTDGERDALRALARKRTASQALSERARIVLAYGAGRVCDRIRGIGALFAALDR